MICKFLMYKGTPVYKLSDENLMLCYKEACNNPNVMPSTLVKIKAIIDDRNKQDLDDEQ